MISFAQQQMLYINYAQKSLENDFLDDTNVGKKAFVWCDAYEKNTSEHFDNRRCVLNYTNAK